MPVKVSVRAQFFITFAAFVVLGASFKVMVLIPGLTEVRPVNAIPPVSGLIFGPVGALACGAGNLVADLFGTFDWTSILGFIANFVAAYLPYRLWHLFSGEAPNLHKNKNILLYLAVCAVSAFTVAWFLAFGLYTFFGFWIEEMYTIVFFNNLGFSVIFGMPFLIILTSDSVLIACRKPGRYFLPGKTAVRKAVCAVYSLFMLIVFACVFFLHMSPETVPWLHALSVLSLLGLVFQLV